MTAWTPGPRNALTDVTGLRVGNAQDDRLKSGVTVVTGDAPFTAAVHIMGGAPGTRDVALLAPDKTVAQVDALVLSGGSAFGLSAADGVMAGLRAQGRGFAVAGHRVPITPAAIVFDLAGGGTHDWTETPYPALGRAALEGASEAFATGTAGAGTGATVAGLKGGLGTASLRLPGGITVGALVVVNALGTPCGPDGHFLAGAEEMGTEFGGCGPLPAPLAPPPVTKLPTEGAQTTIAVIATDATLSKAEATRLATAAHDGFARALRPSHTPLDGDLIFAAATGAHPLPDGAMLSLCHAGAQTMARAIARGVYAASAADGDVFPTWQKRFG